MSNAPRALTPLVAMIAALAGVCAAHAEEPPIPGMDHVTIVEHLGTRLDLDLRFRDHEGNAVTLADYVNGDLPVILTLNYYRCPVLCNVQLNELTKGLKELDWLAGEDFRIVTVSIDPREGPELATRKRAAHLEALGREGADWRFLVGEQPQIEKLAAAIGYGYDYLEDEDEYAHVPAIFVLSPEGMVSRYLYGLQYPARSIKFALIEAADGRVGSTVDKLLLSCFTYDHTKGAYGPFAFGIMRLGGALTALLLGAVLGTFWIRERRQRLRTEEVRG